MADLLFTSIYSLPFLSRETRIERLPQTKKAAAQAALNGRERRAGHLGNFFELHLFFESQGQYLAIQGGQIVHGGADVS